MKARFIVLAMLLAGATVASKRALDVKRFENRPLLLAGRFDIEPPFRFKIHVGEARTPSTLWVRFGECRFIFEFSRQCNNGDPEVLWLQIFTEMEPRDKAEIYAEQEMSGEIDRESVTFEDYHKHSWTFSCETPEGPVDYEVRGYELPPGFKLKPLECEEEPLIEDDWEVATSTSSSTVTTAASSTTRRQLSTTLFSTTLTPAGPSTRKDYRLSSMPLLPHGKDDPKRLLVGSPFFSYLVRHF